LNDASCSSPAAWRSSSQARSGAIESGRSQKTPPRGPIPSDGRSSATIPGLEEDPQVAAHRRRGSPRGRGQLARPVRALAQKLDDALTRRVGEGRQDRSELGCHRTE
jgi:hypothetical protein